MFKVALNKFDYKRLIMALDNWGPRSGKKDAERLKEKLITPAERLIYDFTDKDFKVIFKIATWAGSLKKPLPRKPKKQVKK